MIQYRVKEINFVDETGRPDVLFVPLYKKSIFGIGWWSRFMGFKGTHRIHGACRTLEEAQHYIKEKQNLKVTYHNVQNQNIHKR